MNQFEKLTIWQDSLDLAVEIYNTTKQFPKEELYGLTSQMRRCATSIPSNIAEGSCRNNDGEFKHFLGIASGSSGELKTQLIMSVKLKLITEKEYEGFANRIDSLQKRNYMLQLKLEESPIPKTKYQIPKKMKGINLMDAFSDFKELKNIDRETMNNILDEVFRSMILKRWGADDGFDIIVNPDRGDLEIIRTREVVEDGELDDEVAQIEVSQARKVVDDLDVGEELIEEIKIEDFGRRNILAMRQNLSSRIQELEKDHIYQKYKERVGEIISGEVYQVWKKEILVLDDEDNELILPKDQQIPSDHYKKGDTIRAVVYKVDMRNNSPSDYPKPNSS
jgi:four helix bundle protein